MDWFKGRCSRLDFIEIHRSSIEMAEDRGVKKGLQQGLEQAARNMLASGLSVQQVAELTGLDEQAVKVLASSV